MSRHSTVPADGAETSPTRRSVEIPADQLMSHASDLLTRGRRLALVAAHEDNDSSDGRGGFRLVYLFVSTSDGAGSADATGAEGVKHPAQAPGSVDAGGPDPGGPRQVELVVRTGRDDPSVPSIATISFSAGRFEREVRDMYGIVPTGHPLPRRLIRHQNWPQGWYPMRSDAGPRPPFERADPFPFLTVEGPGVYEIPVGPVHAGVIEPGHFRFSVVGETILKLKARLWFTHKGIEKLAEGRIPTAALPLAERVSGDTSVGHALAYALAVEEALGWRVPTAAGRVRAILLELERLYNHVTDLGALCNDAGHGILNVHALALRERLLRLNADITGHRLLRGAVTLGGVRVRALPESAQITAVAGEVECIADLAMRHSVVRDRLGGTAVLTAQQARELGCLGYVARASGVDHDARRDHPFHEATRGVRAITASSGDVLGRFLVRVGEVEASAALLRELLTGARDGTLVEDAPGRDQATPRCGVGLVEGWRGTIAHRVEIAPDGRIARWKVVDPSFLNWPAVPVALADTIVPDFPLTNKSFNLSYAGNDL